MYTKGHEQRAYVPGNETPPQQPPPRRRVHGYARRPIMFPDAQQQQDDNRLTEEDETLLGYPDVSPDRLPSSVARGWIQQATSQEVVPYQDVDMLNVIVTPRRSSRRAAQLPQRAPRRYYSPEEEERARTTTDRPSPAPPRRRLLHRLHRPSAPLALVLGMVVMAGLVLLFTTLGNIWQGWLDTWHYGYPRTFQTDAIVGHNHDSATRPSHFVAVNLHGAIVVVEYPAGDTTHAMIYDGPTLYGAGADTTPVTLTFKDVTGDGAPDMIIHAGTTLAGFVNDQANNRFRPLQPSDHVVSGSLSSWSALPGAEEGGGGAHGQG